MRVCLLLLFLHAAMPPARADSAALTPARIAALAPDEQPPWLAFLARSREDLAADLAVIYAELEAVHPVDWSAPPEGRGVAELLRKSDDWFASGEAARVVGIVASFQTASGGWGKGIDLQTRLRLPGERFSAGAGNWSYAGTFDNGATVAELRFLARAAATQASARAPLARGLDYVFRAQFPNGGWPQIYPLIGGYHDAVTLNDNAFVNILGLLRDVAAGAQGFATLDPTLRLRAGDAVARGLACLRAAQIPDGGWAQQHDPLTLAPAPARAFEMIALASSESAGVLRFLMELDAPRDRENAASVHQAARWLRAVALQKDGRTEWARFYEIGTNRPLFGDRDGSIHYDLREISEERRKGYAWYSASPASALKKYDKWSAKHALNP